MNRYQEIGPSTSRNKKDSQIHATKFLAPLLLQTYRMDTVNDRGVNLVLLSSSCLLWLQHHGSCPSPTPTCSKASCCHFIFSMVLSRKRSDFRKIYCVCDSQTDNPSIVLCYLSGLICNLFSSGGHYPLCLARSPSFPFFVFLLEKPPMYLCSQTEWKEFV